MQAELSLERASRTPEDAEKTENEALARHGVPDAPTRTEVRRAALRDIVLPCAARLVNVRWTMGKLLATQRGDNHPDAGGPSRAVAGPPAEGL